MKQYDWLHCPEHWLRCEGVLSQTAGGFSWSRQSGGFRFHTECGTANHRTAHEVHSCLFVFGEVGFGLICSDGDDDRYNLGPSVLILLLRRQELSSSNGSGLSSGLKMNQ